MELFEPRDTTRDLVPSPWEILVNSIIPPSPSSLSSPEQDGHQFSSLRRAAHSAHGGSGSGVLIPDILQRAFILASPLRSGALAVSLTERGITAKSLLCRSTLHSQSLFFSRLGDGQPA